MNVIAGCIAVKDGKNFISKRRIKKMLWYVKSSSRKCGKF